MHCNVLKTIVVLYVARVTVCIEDSSDQNVRIFYRPEVHKELAKCRFSACEMKDRVQWLDEIGLSSDQTLVSDIYVVSNGPLKTTAEVEVTFVAIPPAGITSEILIRIKRGGVWSSLDDAKMVGYL